MESSRDVSGGPYGEDPLGTEGERPSKRGKKAEDTQVDAVAHQVFEKVEDEAPRSPKSSTLKRGRDEKTKEDAALIEDKTKKAKDQVLSYTSSYPNVTDVMVHEVADIASQNAIKIAADTLFKSVLDPKLHEQVAKLVQELPTSQRVRFIKRIGVYIKNFPNSLEFFAKVSPEDRVSAMDLIKFLPRSADAKVIFQRLSEKMPIDRLPEKLALLNSLFSENISDKEIKYAVSKLIIDTIPLIPLDLCIKLKLQDIADVRVRAVILTFISKNTAASSPTSIEKLITETNLLLHAALKMDESTTGLKLYAYLFNLLVTIAKVPSESRPAAIKVAGHLLEVGGRYSRKALDSNFITTTTIEQVNNGLLQTKDFFKQFGKTLEFIKEEKAESIFTAFTKVSPKEYADVIKNLSSFLTKNLSETRLVTLLNYIAKIPSNHRGELIAQVDALAKLLGEFYINDPFIKGQLCEALITIPETKRSSLLKQIAPLLESYHDHVAFKNLYPDLLKFVYGVQKNEHTNLIDEQAVGHTRSLIAKVIKTHWSGDGSYIKRYEIDPFEYLQAVAKIPVNERKDVIDAFLDALEYDFHIGKFTTSCLPAITAIPAGQRKSVITFAMKLLEHVEYDPKNIEKILEVIIDVDSSERPFVIETTLAYLNEKFDVEDVISLLQVIASIPGQKEIVIAYANELQAGIEEDLDTQDTENLIRAIINVDPAERPLVIETTLANLDEASDIQDIIDLIEYYNAYTLKIPQAAIKDRPLELLTQIAEQIAKKRARRISVTFEGEVGQDVGGLGRVFISELFDALKTRLKFQVRDGTGLCSPIATDTLSDETKEAYTNIGRVLMFCLNATTDYPIGMIFEQSVFTALTKLQDRHLNQPIQKLVQDKEAYGELCAIYTEMYRLDESAQGTLEWLQSNKNEPEAQKMIHGMMIDVFGPLAELAKGMRAVLFKDITSKDVQRMSPVVLSEKIQGKVSKEMILAALQIDDSIPAKVGQWVREWIEKADNRKLAEFLMAMTGSPALGTKSLKIEACNGEKTIFHTCDNRAELPIEIMDSQEKLTFILDNMLGGGKFTLA